jgi:hypothetical protein
MNWAIFYDCNENKNVAGNTKKKLNFSEIIFIHLTILHN